MYTTHRCTTHTVVHRTHMYTVHGCTLYTVVHRTQMYTTQRRTPYTVLHHTQMYNAHRCTLHTVVHCTQMYTTHRCTTHTDVHCTQMYTAHREVQVGGKPLHCPFRQIRKASIPSFPSCRSESTSVKETPRLMGSSHFGTSSQTASNPISDGV